MELQKKYNHLVEIVNPSIASASSLPKESELI